MMPKFFSNNSNYSIGDIVHLLNVALPKFEEIAIPDFYIIVRDISHGHYDPQIADKSDVIVRMESGRIAEIH